MPVLLSLPTIRELLRRARTELPSPDTSTGVDTHAILELYPQRPFAGEVTSSSQSNSAIPGMVACEHHNGAYFWPESSAACAVPCSAPCRPGAFASAVSNSFSAGPG